MGQKVFDQSGWLSGSTRVVATVPGETPPPPPIPGGGNFRTMIGTWNLPTGLWGTAVTPDATKGDSNGTNFVGGGGYCGIATANDACFISLVTGGSQSGVRDSNGDFSGTLWGALFNDWADEVDSVGGGNAEMRTAVRTGRFRAVEVLDDFISARSSPTANGFNHAASYTQIELAGSIAKARWPWMPLVARGVNTYLKSAATLSNGTIQQYHYLDAGWAQYRASLDADPATFYQTNIAAGEACGLGLVGGANLLDRGAGTTPGWGCQIGNDPARCAMSPAEIRAAGFAALANPKVAGFMLWTYASSGGLGHTYWDKTEIQSAMSDVHQRALSTGRVDGRINIRGDLGTP